MYAYTTGTLGTLQDTITYTYGNTAWKDQLTNYDGTAISYDASGNPTNWIGNLNTLTWTGRQLSSISMPNNQSINFKYNSDGIRTYKYFIDNDEMYLYQHDYMLEGSTIVGEKVYYFSYYNGTWTKYKYYYYDESGSPIGMGYEGKDYYFQKNILGDIEAIYQGSTKVVQYTYDAWGNVLSVTGSLASTIGQENPFRYRGYYYDTETGLYYLQSRYYDPQVGRFINADDALFIDATGTLLGCNLYAYCENNPVNNVDLTGYVVTPANVIGAVVGLVLGAVGGYFLSRFLADKIGLKGWKRTAFIVGISAIISASATVIGYFIGPYIAKTFKALLNGLRGLFKPKIGTQLGRLGTLTRNTKPVIKGLTDHGLKRITERGVSEALAQKIVNTGFAVAQHGGKVLYFTKEGVVVLTSTGQIVTAYTSAYFDEAMQAIVSLFYK